MKAGHWFIILFAACIDLLQAGFGLLLGLLPFAAGPVGGAAGGALLCQKAGETVMGICAAVGGVIGSYFGSVIGAAAVPIGIPLGIVISAVLAMTLGVGLMALLAFSGCFYPTLVFAGFFGEVIPGMGFLPVWTGIAIASVRKHAQEEGEGGGLLVTAANIALPGGAPRELLRRIRMKEEPRDVPIQTSASEEPRGDSVAETPPRVQLLNKDIHPVQKTGDTIKKPGPMVR